MKELTLEGHSLVIVSQFAKEEVDNEILWSAIDSLLLLSQSQLSILSHLFLSGVKDFRGKVYAPEPLLSFWAMESLESSVSPLFVTRALQKCRSLSFHETITLEPGLTVTPCPSGTGLGDCHWIIDFHGQKVLTSFLFSSNLSSKLTVVAKIVYVGAMEFYTPTVSLSRSLTVKEGFQGAQVLLDGGGCESVTETHMENLKNVIYQNLESKCHCILPTRLAHAPGIIPILCQWARVANTRVHFIASGSSQALKCTDLLGEWMNESRQALVHSGSPPTEWSALVGSELLILHSSLMSLLRDPRGPLSGPGQSFRPSLILSSVPYLGELLETLQGRIALLWTDFSMVPSPSLLSQIKTRPESKLIHLSDLVPAKVVNTRTNLIADLASQIGTIQMTTADSRVAQRFIEESVTSVKGSLGGGLASNGVTGNSKSPMAQPVHGSLSLSSFIIR